MLKNTRAEIHLLLLIICMVQTAIGQASCFKNDEVRFALFEEESLFFYRTPQGPKGVAVDVISQMSNHLNIKPKIIPLPPSRIIQSTASGSVDIGFIPVVKGHEAHYEQVQGIIIMDMTLINIDLYLFVHPDHSNIATHKSPSQISNLKLGVLRIHPEESRIFSKINTDYVSFPNAKSAIHSLIAKRIDGVIFRRDQFHYYAKRLEFKDYIELMKIVTLDIKPIVSKANVSTCQKAIEDMIMSSKQLLPTKNFNELMDFHNENFIRLKNQN